MKRMILCLVCLLLLLAGCSVEREVLDDIYIITLAAYDWKDEHIETTLVVPTFTKDGQVQNEFYTTEGILNKEMMKKISYETPYPLLPGKLEVAVFSEDFAKKGFMEATDVYRRDPSISANVQLAVYDGPVEEFVNSKSIQTLNYGIYVSKIIEQAISKENIPETNLHLFFQQYYAVGEDPFLPLMGLKEDKIKIKGIALFKNDKMVGTIPADKLHIFTMLHDKLSKGRFSIELPKLKARVSIGNIRTTKDLVISGPLSSPHIKITIGLRGMINEYYGNREGIANKINKIEKMVNKQLEKEAEKMIVSFQEKGIDPLGIGKEAKANYRNWDREKWKERYPDLRIDVEIHTDILESGIIQ